MLFLRGYLPQDRKQSTPFIDARGAWERGLKVLVTVIRWQLLLLQLLVIISHKHLNMGDNVRDTSPSMSMCGAQVGVVGDQILVIG